MQVIFDFFSFAGKEVGLLLTAMMPVVELRGAIPLGAALGMDWTTVFLIAIIGNLIPVPFIVLFGKKIIGWLKTTKLLSGITHKIEKRIMRKSEDVLKYSAIGLCLFVAIPLPGTGAWTGAAVAALLDMSMKYAIISITIGVLIAGVVMTLGSYGILQLF